MKYALQQCTDGTFSIPKQNMTDLATAQKWWHHYSEALYGDSSFTYACLTIVDENLNLVEGGKYTTVIRREPEPAPEPEPSEAE